MIWLLFKLSLCCFALFCGCFFGCFLVVWFDFVGVFLVGWFCLVLLGSYSATIFFSTAVVGTLFPLSILAT